MRMKDDRALKLMFEKIKKKKLLKSKKNCECEKRKLPKSYSNFDSPSFEHFTERSSIHGLRFLSKRRNNNFSRIFWSVALIMSLVGLIYNGKRLYIKLNISPDIGISVKHELANKIPFPAITVCLPLFAKNGMANRTRYFDEYHKHHQNNILNLTESEKKYLSANAMRCGINRLDPILNCCKDTNITNMVQLMDESSLTIDEALISCSVELEFTDCKKIFQRILTSHGFCFTTNMQQFDTIFNSKALSEDFKTNIRRGKWNSSIKTDKNVYWTLDKGYKNDSVTNVVPLRLNKANIHALRIFSKLDDANNQCTSKNIVVKLHLPNEIPTSFHKGFQFEHTHSEQLVLSAKVTKAHESLKYYSPQQRGCYFSDERKLQFFKIYTRNHCYLECLTNHILEKCGCVAFHMPRNSTTTICDLDDGKCLHDSFYKWPTDDDMADGKTPCECYPTCNNIEYTVQEIDTLYDSASNADVIKNYSSELLYSKLFVYFDDHIIQLNEKYVSYKLQNFIADLGGLLGLFLGCSLLSMIEVLYFVCTTLKKRCQKKKAVANIRVKQVTPVNDDIWNNLEKNGDEVFIFRGPLYNRKRF